MSLTGKYIYCFVKEKEKVNICTSTVASMIAPVYTLPHGDVSAVVSDTDVFEYDPTRKNILAHQRVVTQIMGKYTIIPVAFGTVASGKSEIERIIADNTDHLLEQLEIFKDKAELGLRVTWKDDFFNRDIENDKIIELEKKVFGKDENEVLLEKIQLGKLVEKAIEIRKAAYIAEIYDPLSRLAVKSMVKESIPIKTVFSAGFLIQNAISDEFDSLVEKLAKPYENKLVFNYTGPWPPYNFVDIKLRLNSDEKERQE